MKNTSRLNNIMRNTLLTAAFMVVSSPAYSVPIVNGYMTAGEYDTSFTAGWYNGHQESGSQYQKADSFETEVWYTSTVDNFFLYIEAPVEVKNMIWGTGFSIAKATEYYQHWCSPNDGNPAALDGSNCAHHADGFATFLADKTDYGAMTGSEKVIFAGGYTADLAGSAGGSLQGHSLLNYKDSVDYVIASLGCDTIDCNADTTPMSFELKFDAFTAAELASLIANIQSGELEFHLSPEWGGNATTVSEPDTVAVSEPSTLALFGLGLAGIAARRRKYV